MNLKRHLAGLSLSAAFALAASGAGAQQEQEEQPEQEQGQYQQEQQRTGQKGGQPQRQTTQAAEQTLNRLQQTSQMEIQMAQVAERQAQSEEVKTYAEQVGEDHRKLLDKVQQTAKDEKMKLQKPDMKQGQQAMQQLRGVSGQQFDMRYLQQQQQSHQQVVTELKQSRQNIADPEIGAVVDEAIDTMNEHQEKAEQLMRDMQQQGQGQPKGEGQQNQGGQR